MAYAMTKRGSLDNCITYEFMCDTVADMNRIENEYRTLGSVAIVLNGESGSLEVYITDSSKEWHNFSAASGGGSAAEGAGLKLHLCTLDEIEEGLPNISSPDENTIYLVPGSEEENNLYEEYFYIDDGWEKFGSAGISLNDISSIYAPIASPNFTGSISLGRKTNTTVGSGSVAEGDDVTASGNQSHAEGASTTASGNYSHAEGGGTTANGNLSHAEGSGNPTEIKTVNNKTYTGTGAHGSGSHSEGTMTWAIGQSSHAEGGGTTASGYASHAEGAGTTASGSNAHVEGGGTTASGSNAHAEGGATTASGSNAHAEGYQTSASNSNAHAEGDNTIANGINSHAEGKGNKSSTITINGQTYTGTGAYGLSSHAEGENTWAIGNMSHAEGQSTTASSNNSHAEGGNTTASGVGSHAEGMSTIASETGSHAEGLSTHAYSFGSHTEGINTVAEGAYSHVSGAYNVVDSYANWSEWIANTSYKVGDKVKITTGSGSTQTIKGYICKIANSDSTFTSSKWTFQDGKMNYVEIIGNGAGSPSNARVLDWDGNEHLMGDLYVGCNGDSTGGVKIPRIPSAPVADGTYTLQATVTNGTPTYSWVSVG